jgi:hypothetical protein
VLVSDREVLPHQSAPDPLTNDRWRALTHWVVVFMPGDDCKSIPRWYDNGVEGPATPKAAAEQALAELRERLEASAAAGGSALDELEVLVFERGNETARFELDVAFREHPPSPPSDWRGGDV